MRILSHIIFLAAAATCTVLSGPVWSQTSMNGQIGADVGSYSFSNFVFSDDTGYSVDRRLSNQFVDLGLGGPLINGYFASYALSARINGTQIRSVTDDIRQTEYINPSITNYYGSAVLFPGRRLPIAFYTSRNEEYSIRYEQNNKGEVEIVDPGLTVLRRYQVVTDDTGVDVAYAASPALNFVASYADKGSQLIRQYDFDENKNIWVDFSILNPGQGPMFEVAVVNTIPDRDVLLYVDEAFVDTIPAGATVPVIVEGGSRRLEFAPEGLNTFRTTYNVNANMVWRIFFNDPPGGKDRNALDKEFRAAATYDNLGAFTNRFTMKATDGTETVQDIDTGLLTAINNARYVFSRNTDLMMKTTYAVNDQTVGTFSKRKNQTLTNFTSASWNKPRRFFTRLSHRLLNMNTDQQGRVTKSTGHMLDGTVGVPTHWNNHEVSLRLNADILDDNIATGHKTYQAMLGNTLKTRRAGFLWTPTHELRVMRGWTEKGDSRNRELESRLRLMSERMNWGHVGDLMVQGEWGWRSLATELAENTRNTLAANMSLRHQFSNRYSVSFLAGIKTEEFGIKALGEDEGEDIPPPQNDTRTRDLGVSVMMSPWDDLSLVALASHNSSREAENVMYSGSLNWDLPWIDTPFRFQVSNSDRQQSGQPPQKDFRVKVAAGRPIRKIKLTLSYNYVDSSGAAEHYKYGEFAAIVTRAFDVK